MAQADGQTQVKLTYTNCAFTHHGVLMAGVPILLTDDMKIAEGPQRWLFYITLDRGRTRSPATWRSYAEALYDWLQTCQANGWAWDEIGKGIFAPRADVQRLLVKIDGLRMAGLLTGRHRWHAVRLPRRGEIR